MLEFYIRRNQQPAYNFNPGYQMMYYPNQFQPYPYQGGYRGNYRKQNKPYNKNSKYNQRNRDNENQESNQQQQGIRSEQFSVVYRVCLGKHQL